MVPPSLPFDPARLPDPHFKVPDYADEFIGWRAWEVSGIVPPFGVSPRLESIVQDYYWTPRRTLEAECAHQKRGGKNSTGPPCDQGCGCGFYSAKSYDHLLGMHYHVYDGEVDGKYCVIGRAANWGKVIEGTLGWRAQYSYPIELFVPYEIWKLAKPLAEGYGCAVRLDNFLKPGNAIA